MENKNTETVGFFDGIGALVKSGVRKRRGDSTALLYDAVVLLISFVFARCHIVIGTYPIALSFVAVLPSGIWIALIGGVLGSLTLGKMGIIQAIVIIIVVFLRIIISGNDRNSEISAFSEPLVLKISSASIAASVGAMYEVLLRGFTVLSVLYGATLVLLSALFTFAFSGIFDSGVSFSDFLLGRKNIFSLKRSDKERFDLYLFQAAFLLFVFLISISLKDYNILGISPAYIFSAFITLIVARRYGLMRAMATGFVSSLAVSSVYSVAFALAGLCSGLLFSAGLGYAIVGGAMLLSAWSAYAGGALGFLTVFPEYAVASMLAFPLLRKMMPEQNIDSGEMQKSREAEDMVMATALSYRNSSLSFFGEMENSLLKTAKALYKLGVGEGSVELSEYRDNAIECIKCFCRDCPSYTACVQESPAPCVENIEFIAMKLYNKERIFGDEPNIVPKYCHNSASLFDAVTHSAALLEESRYKSRKIEAIAEEYELFAKLIGEARLNAEKERSQNVALTDKLSEIFEQAGLHDGVIKVFGERKKYFIGAGEDKDGTLITSPELHKDIEACAGVRLGVAEYYRKGDIALFECGSAPMYSVEFATSGKRSGAEEISGDTAVSFESADGHFYSLVADGMGSGDAAHKTSHFTADFLSSILGSSCSKNTAFHILNHIIKNRSEECSSTVDLFDFDLITGEALFYKCGAAPSYVKRDNSIFRIRSETAPLGLMKSIDAEKIRVEVKSGDYIIMLSDGVSQSSDDAAWLIELLSREPKTDMRDYAEFILEEAEKHSKSRDDMSVAVARVSHL
jgi:stage II sporulation protein E